MGVGAAVTWTLVAVGGAGAQVHVNVDLGHHPGASIRFGSTPPRRVVPVVPPAAVRYEHFVAPGRREVHGPYHEVREHEFYRNPYRDDYFRRFRPGWRPIVVRGVQYYAYPVLPPGYQTVVVNGVTYYLLDGVYYQPTLYEGQTMYMVVPPPIP
jgi:hypothetical protein